MQEKKNNIPINVLLQALKNRVYHKTNVKRGCQNALSWVQIKHIHNRSMMQN